MTQTEPTPPRRVFIETWGCQMNELDTQRMLGQLMQQGVLPTRDPHEADLILLNSCSVREKAVQKVYSRLGEYRLMKRGRELLIGLCGCVAQQEGERAMERIPDLDFVVGPARVGRSRRSSPPAGRGSGWLPPASRGSGTTTLMPSPGRPSTRAW